MIEPWPADYAAEIKARRRRLSDLRRNPDKWAGAKEFYKHNHHSFIRHWGITYDPRNLDSDTPALLPFIPFLRQRELSGFIYSCWQQRQSGLIEKSRDMGATWNCCQVSVHLWLFWDAAIGWGSRKSMLVDRIGDPDSIFEKIRTQLRNLPDELMPAGFNWDEHANLMRIINPETGATITGEGGDDIGRGGRKSVYFVDEAAHLEHPESIEAALNSNTDCRIDISSVGAPGNVFHRKREAGVEYDPKVGVVRGRTNVFVMDWRQHPGKSQAWYDEKRQKAEDEGLLHVHAQEVDRDYAASIQGTVIPAAWVRAAIDAHKKLRFEEGGRWGGALDVADEGGDRNALVLRRGVIVRDLQEWGERDTGRTARRAIAACEGLGSLQLQYDAVGVGSGVKAETNRLKEERLMPRGLRFVPWNGGAGPQWPKRRVVPDDKDSPLNEEFYRNLKAQGWWQLRRRFELTYKAVTLVDKGRTLTQEEMLPKDLMRLAIRHLNEAGADPKLDEFDWDEADLIALPSTIPNVWKVVKELSQPTVIKDSKLKLLIDKKPEGTMSPNLADAVMMAFWPVQAGGFEISDEVLKRSAEPPPPPDPVFHKPAPRPQPQLPPRSEFPSAPGSQGTNQPQAQPVMPRPRLRLEPQLRSTRPPVAPVQKIGE